MQGWCSPLGGAVKINMFEIAIKSEMIIIIQTKNMVS